MGMDGLTDIRQRVGTEASPALQRILACLLDPRVSARLGFYFANPGENEEGKDRSRREMGRLRKRERERTEGEAERKRKRVEERAEEKGYPPHFSCQALSLTHDREASLQDRRQEPQQGHLGTRGV